MTGRVVLASGNQGKLAEMQVLLEPLGTQLVSQGELGIDAPDEPYATFLENALHKARHASAAAGLPAIADDSGLTVAALGGAPGVYSARYAGPEANDAANNALLVQRLSAIDGHPDAEFDAAFNCFLVYVTHAEDPAPCVAIGRWAGKIVLQPRGEGGFGYDPLFLVPDLGKTSAELPAVEKNVRSHRGQAMQRLLELLRDR